VLGGLLGLRHPDLAVVVLADHGRVEGADRSRVVELEHRLVVGVGIRDLVIDDGVEESGLVGHAGSLRRLGVLDRPQAARLRGRIILVG
jgi:hypothetical protein